MARTALVLAALLALAGCARPRPVEVADLAMGLVTVESNADFETTYRRLVEAVEATGTLRVLAEFDHAANARQAGLALAPTRVLVFGNPEAGTPLMQAERTVALDLPLRVLVWEEGGRVRLAYPSPYDLARRHGLRGEAERVARMNGVLSRLVARAAGA